LPSDSTGIEASGLASKAQGDERAVDRKSTGAATVDTSHSVPADVEVTTTIRSDAASGDNRGQMRAVVRMHNPDGTTSVLRLQGELKDTMEQHAIVTYSFNGDTQAAGCSGSPDAFTSTLSVNDERGTSSLSVTFGDPSKPSAGAGASHTDAPSDASPSAGAGLPNLTPKGLPVQDEQRYSGSQCADGRRPQAGIAQPAC
jgi:hypothetical protein